MPALMLLYGLTLFNENRKSSKKELLLFLPFTLVMLLAIYYRYQLIVKQKPPKYSSFLDGIPTWSEYIAIAGSILVCVYLYLRVTKHIKESSFSTKKIAPQLQWFKMILIAQFFSISLWTYSEISFGSGDENHYYYPLWIVLSVIIYWMGHVGIYKYGITQERKKIRSEKRLSYSVAEKQAKKSEAIKSLQQYIIEEKNYLNPQLTLEKTAQALHLSQGHLSKLINTELQQSFKEYLNNLRVEEAKLYLQNPEFSNYTLVAIGLEAGFNSKSAFNASFKKVTGLTPSQFKSHH